MSFLYTLGTLLQSSLTPFDFIDDVGTPLALIAFIVASVFWYFRYRDLEKRKMLEKLTDDSKVQTAQIILDNLHVDTQNLTDKQKYNLAMQKLKDKARHRMTISILLAFLAVIALIMVLFYNPKEITESSSPLNKQFETVSYRINVEVYQDSVIKREVIGTKEHLNDHCQGSQNIDWRIIADSLNGWHIDITTINAQADLRERSVFSGIFNQSKNGFNLRGIVRNKGKCNEVLGQIVTHDARGKMHIAYSYFEEKLIRSRKPYNKKIEGTFLKGNIKEVEIPENIADYTIILTDEKGNTIELSNGVIDQKKFSVKQVGKTKLIIQSKI